MVFPSIRRFPAFIFANIENIIFSLSTSFISIVLLICAGYVICRQTFGSFILCNTFKEDLDPGNLKALGTFCFYKARVPSFLVGRSTSSIDGNPFNKHDIYQWVPYILFFQSLLFVLPKLYLQQMEGNIFKTAMPNFVKERELLASKNDRVKTYEVYKNFLSYLLANNYAELGTIFSECINICIVMLQVYLMKVNLGTNFYEDVSIGNPFDDVFPKQILCSMPKFGPNGTIVDIVANCVLPINYINESIYSYLWICVNLLLGLTTLVVLYRLMSLILYCRSNAFNRFEFDRLCRGPLKKQDMMITSKWGFCRWFTLRRLANRMTGSEFSLLLEVLRSNSKEAANHCKSTASRPEEVHPSLKKFTRP